MAPKITAASAKQIAHLQDRRYKKSRNQRAPQRETIQQKHDGNPAKAYEWERDERRRPVKVAA